MRRHHPTLVEILGREDEVRNANPDIETPGPADLLLAADTPGHLLISGPRGCEHEILAKIVYDVSKRRSQAFVPVEEVPTDRRRQGELLKKRADKGTLVLDLRAASSAPDPTFVDQLFSAAYDIRVIVLARTAEEAREALGERAARQLLHAELAPMARRQTAIFRLLDRWLQLRNSVLRMDDLTEANLQALFRNDWPNNLAALREAAVRLDAIASAGLSRKHAAEDEALQISRQGLDYWYNESMGFEKDLVTPSARLRILAALAARTQSTNKPE
jgi:DNA-binding NtrC family response regulator